jgi:hypothetical protein
MKSAAPFIGTAFHRRRTLWRCTHVHHRACGSLAVEAAGAGFSPRSGQNHHISGCPTNRVHLSISRIGFAT